MDNDFISAFAFSTGRQIEELVKGQTNNLQERNQILEAKILDWYAKSKDENFAEHFGIKEDRVHRFITQPIEIEKLMKEKWEHRMINDNLGWTGEWRMSAKDVLDVIIDLQNGV